MFIILLFGILSGSAIAASDEINSNTTSDTPATYRTINGVIEYPRIVAKKLQSSSDIEWRKSFPSVAQLESAVAAEAKKRGAYAFYIRFYAELSPQRYYVVASFFDSDAKELTGHEYDALPEKNTSIEPAQQRQVSTEKTQTSQPTGMLQKLITSYSTVPAAKSTEAIEINKAAAKRLTSYDSFSFKIRRLASHAEINEIAKKEATAKNATYYNIEDIIDKLDNNNATVLVKIYK